MLLSLNEFFRAIESFNKAIKLENSNADAYFLKGRCLDRLSRVKEALECYGQAIKYEHVDAYNFKGFLLPLNKPNESIELFEKVER